MENIRYYIPGTILILIAIMIVAVPEILVAIVAGLVIMAGIGALYLGHMTKKARVNFPGTDRWFFDSDAYRGDRMRRPTFRFSRWM